MEKPKKEKPKRKLPKKSERAKRRYVLFSLKEGSCPTSKMAFDLVMGQFSMEERKQLGLWFIEFMPQRSRGIVRCNKEAVERLRQGIEAIPKEFGPETVRTSGTIKALKR